MTFVIQTKVKFKIQKKKNLMRTQARLQWHHKCMRNKKPELWEVQMRRDSR